MPENILRLNTRARREVNAISTKRTTFLHNPVKHSRCNVSAKVYNKLPHGKGEMNKLVALRLLRLAKCMQIRTHTNGSGTVGCDKSQPVVMIDGAVYPDIAYLACLKSLLHHLRSLA